jgi:hypothetical protein
VTDGVGLDVGVRELVGLAVPVGDGVRELVGDWVGDWEFDGVLVGV